MKKTYKDVVLEIIAFEETDITTASNLGAVEAVIPGNDDLQEILKRLIVRLAFFLFIYNNAG